jgi:hypothetical protein
MDFSTNSIILEEELLPLIRERLAAGFAVRYMPFRGVSMLPMLRQGKDSVELSPLPEKLKKFDLPVYQRPNGQLVMHRVVDVKEDHYICMGDNTEVFEKIYPNQMIGVVSAFRRGEKRIEVTDRGYQLYCRLWRPLRPLRKGYKALKRLARKCLKKLFGRCVH